MARDLEIRLLGELRVFSHGVEVALPSSRKARALLGFLVATARPHRRERLCELFWDMPDDPRASLRWALTKLRDVVDVPGQTCIVADRERVHIDLEHIEVDLKSIYRQTKDRDARPALADLETMAERLDLVLLDGLDGAGDERFHAWLLAEREDARAARIEVLRQLAVHPQATQIAREKWTRLWRLADPASDTVPETLSAEKSAAKIDGGRVIKAARTTVQQANGVRPKASVVRAWALRKQRIGFCQVRDGTKIAYATVGSGPPLMKAANWLNHLEFDWESPIWGRSFAAISRFRTFVHYDERGCGLSDWDVADLSFDAFVEDLEVVVDQLGLDRFPLLGISQGCAVSIEYAVRHPERVTGLVLIGGYAAGWRLLASPEEQARREAVMKLTEVGWGTDNPAYRHIFSQTFMPDANPGDLAWFDEFQRQTTSPKNAARFQEAFGHIDVRHRLAEVRVPTIVLHSKHDLRIPLEMGRSIAAAIPGARFVPLESRNHILVEHEPAWRTCVEAVGQFLAEKDI